jgi:hypothetical protein
MSSRFLADTDLGCGVKTGRVGALLVAAAILGCGPAEDFQGAEPLEELSDELKLPVATVSASSVQPGTNHVGANASDGNLSTRWASAWSDPQWLTLDLGAKKTINRVVLRWEAAYSRDFDLQISDDVNGAFTTFRSIRGKSSAAVDDLAVTATGRYVRLYSLARATSYGVSLWEVEVHAPDTPSPSAVAVPAKIQAEAPARFYDTTATNLGAASCSSTALDAQTTTDVGGGCNVGWTAAGEWLEWDVSAAAGGSFDIVARLAANATGKTVHFELDGARVGTTLTAPAAGFQAFSDVTAPGISVAAGNHKLRLVIDTGDVNVNWLEVKNASTTTPQPNKDNCKRGVAYGGNSSEDLTVLSNGLSWWYNWDQRPESGAASVSQSLGVEFVPMIWGESHISRATATIPTGLRTLLGFNEPNFGSQSNLTPERAAELWPQLEQIAAAKGIGQIASPAVNYCGGSCTDTNPINWLKRFYAACRARYANGCKVDYTAYHTYVCQLSWLQGKIQELTNAHNQALSNGDPRDDNDFNKPIWLTEFACGDKPASWPSITSQHQIDYVNAALPWLEGDSRIMRYAWFSGRTTAVPNASLLGSSGQLTALGRAYLAQPHNPSCPLKSYTP